LRLLREISTQQTQVPASRNAMLGRRSGNHDWLLVAFLAVFVYATHATHATQAIMFEWKPGLSWIPVSFWSHVKYLQLDLICFDNRSHPPTQWFHSIAFRGDRAGITALTNATYIWNPSTRYGER